TLRARSAAHAMRWSGRWTNRPLPPPARSAARRRPAPTPCRASSSRRIRVTSGPSGTTTTGIAINMRPDAAGIGPRLRTTDEHPGNSRGHLDLVAGIVTRRPHSHLDAKCVQGEAAPVVVQQINVPSHDLAPGFEVIKPALRNLP